MVAAAKTRYLTVWAVKDDPRKRNEYAERTLPQMGQDSAAMYRALVIENGTQDILSSYDASVDATMAFWRGIGGEDIKQRATPDEMLGLGQEARAKLMALEEAVRTYLVARQNWLEVV